MKRLSVLAWLLMLCVWAAAMPSRERDSVDYYFKQAEKLYQQGDHRQALDLFEKARGCVAPASPFRNEYAYSELIDYIATLRCEFGEVDTAIALEDEVIQWRRDHKSDFGVIGVAVSKKAVFYSYKKDYASAIRFGEEAAELIKRRYGEKDHSYSVNLQNMASFYSMRGSSPQDFQKAVQLAEQAVRHMDTHSPDYAYALNNLVVYYSQAENRQKANELTTKALQKGRSIFGKQSRAYADLLANQAVRLANVNNYSQAIDYSLEARSIYEADSAVHSLPYARILGSLGSFCKQAERFDLGIDALTVAQQVYQQNQAQNTQEYINCVSNLAALYRLKGDLERADEIALQSAQLVAQTPADGNYLTYGKSLSEQAWMYAANGNFQRAIEGEMRALIVFSQNKDTLNMAVSMNDLSSHYFNHGEHEQALDFCQQSIDLLRRAHLQNTATGRALNNLAIYHFRLGDNKKAIELGRQAVENYEQLGDTQGSMYSKLLANLAMYYFKNDSIDAAISITQRALDIQRTTLGPEHPDLVVTYHNLANYYLAKNDVEHMRQSFEQALDMQSRLVRNNFSHLTTSGREQFWNTKNYVFKIAPVFASRSNGDAALIGDAFNATLFTKGILLNSEIDFENFLTRTGRTELLQKYEQLEQLHKRIDDYRHSASFDRFTVDALQREANSLERQLMRECKEFGDFTANLSITYQQVAASLAPTAAAVEFIDMPLPDGDRLYAALCLRHDWTSPRLVPLFNQTDLVNLDYGNGLNLHDALKTPKGINQIYTNPLVGHFVWYPLMKELGDDTRTVYFSPTGIFHQLGIEYLQYTLEQRVNERYEIHRLSSTKSIAQDRTHQTPTMAAVFGGLTYDMDREDLVQRHNQYTAPIQNLLAQNDGDNTRALSLSNSAAIDSLSRAGLRVKPLPGTLTEARDVNAALSGYGIDTHLYTEELGTEEAFKSLSGRNCSLIHVATHGFYFSESDISRNRQLLRLMGPASSAETIDQDRSMDYSGLLMSGANVVLRGLRLPEGIENGVLTAREISQLDLRGLDLVVLSACQTGQGELKEDGVYGLQRAFKKAGAKTLVMSLWSVSDAATQRMMSSFYTALAAGQTRFHAFSTAQQAVRDAGYTDPFYWASFIMLDDTE